MGRENEIHLSDIFHVDMLQELQDSFYRSIGVAMGVSDSQGVAVTKHSGGSDFCNCIKGTTEGLKRCQTCDKFGAQRAIEQGKYITYTCHAGLVDFAAPISVEGSLLGCFLGGQVLLDDLDENKIRALAGELGINQETLVEHARKIKKITPRALNRGAELVYNVTNIMSSLALTKYYTKQESHEIEKAANMKSDFLANMSHEIRTPMNAVIGMAEMALREELPPAAREYIHQIKTAGNTLLAIINDILDFSKIESGKMDITVAEYEPLELIREVTNIIMTRIGDKNIELIFDIDPTLPRHLLGDVIRIKQVIINLANNAVKFTNEGKVEIKIWQKSIADNQIMLHCEVKDTGIGIKREDIKKIFQSFQQVDSKRNRNVEGTGLGLAISQNIVHLMNGEIKVESEYGEGSTFCFHIPQFALDKTPGIEIKNEEQFSIAGLIDNDYVESQLIKDAKKFSLIYEKVTADHLDDMVEKGVRFFFIDHPLFTSEVEDFIKEHTEITAVLLVGFKVTMEYNIPNLKILKKPLYVQNLGQILNHESLFIDDDDDEMKEFDFIAPEAEILIVDDNKINLTVAAGILEPLQMKIETALSGKEAISKISVKHYDLIFMDHMMPELDGVETTHIIRRFHEEYNDVPIIALSANAVEETRAMFLVEGMNDFVAKPIEIRTILSKLRQWLPADKIVKVEKDKFSFASKETNIINIPKLDTEYAIKLLGGESLFWSVLEDYYRVIDKKAGLIREKLQNGEWDDYTIEVHALKSASKQIGAIGLSEKAAALEKAGNDKNISFITEHTEEVLDEYMEYKDILADFITIENDEGTEPISREVLLEVFEVLETALDNLELDAMEQAVEQLKGYRYPAEQQIYFEQMKEAVSDIDVDACEEILARWRQEIL